MFITGISLFKQGVVGLFLWEQMLSLFSSEVVTSITFFFAFIVGFVVLFDTNIAQLLKTLSRSLLFIKKITFGLSPKHGKKIKSTREDAVYSPVNTDIPPREKSIKDDYVIGVPPVIKTATNPIFSGPLLSSSSHQAWAYPPLSIFDDTPGTKADRGDVRKNAGIIEQTLDSFGITARVADVNNSPSVTQYALEVALGTKLAKNSVAQQRLGYGLGCPRRPNSSRSPHSRPLLSRY